jgi:hypothetical protein
MVDRPDTIATKRANPGGTFISTNGMSLHALWDLAK